MSRGHMRRRGARGAPTATIGGALLLAASLLVPFALGSCAHAQHPQATARQQNDGTCPGACEHYVTCKRDDASSLYNACVSQCRQIFADRGVEDHDTLRDFEHLDCPATVSFVEGSHGHEPSLSPSNNAGGTESAQKK